MAQRVSAMDGGEYKIAWSLTNPHKIEHSWRLTI